MPDSGPMSPERMDGIFQQIKKALLTAQESRLWLSPPVTEAIR